MADKFSLRLLVPGSPLWHIKGHNLEKLRLLIPDVLVWRVGQVLLSLLLWLIMLDGLENLKPRATVPLE